MRIIPYRTEFLRAADFVFERRIVGVSRMRKQSRSLKPVLRWGRTLDGKPHRWLLLDWLRWRWMVRVESR